MRHERYMKEALAQAALALDEGEFPVGCVIVHKGVVEVTARRSHSSSDAVNEIDHAEITALRQISGIIPHDERKETVIYSTMEPCLMCYAAIMLSGIRHIVYAFEDAMGGGTSCDLKGLAPLYSSLNMFITPHVLRKESLELFKRFFLLPENRYWKGSYLEQYTLSVS